MTTLIPSLLDAVTAIGISLTSLHVPHDDQNQFNPGIHVEMENYRAGVYYNSKRRTTAYVGYSLPLFNSDSFRVGALVALGSGYDSPIIGGLEFTVGPYLTLLAVPPIPNYSDLTVGVALRIPTK